MIARRRMLLAALAAAATARIRPAPAAELITEVVPAGYRDARELAEALKPLVPPPGSVSAFGNQLVIRTSRENLTELRRVLASLDRPPANLLITVKRTLDAEISRDLAAAGIRLRSGDVTARAGEHVGRREDGSGASVRLERSITTRREGELQSLRVLEGREAFIHAGESVPVGERQVLITGGGVALSEGVRYEEFGSGFRVRPRLNGDRVTLDILPGRRDRRGDGSAVVQEAATAVSGVLGRWMQIGGVDSGARRSGTGIGSSRTVTTQRHDAIYVKVERLN